MKSSSHQNHRGWLPTLRYRGLSVQIERIRGSELKWEVVCSDGRRVVWSGFHTGPRVLEEQAIAEVAARFLSLSLDALSAAAQRELRPFISDTGPERSLVMHSATPVLKFLEADLGDARHGRPPDDVATYIETRAVILAGDGDLVVGRTAPWKAAAELEGVEAVCIPGIDYYYLSHALLKLLADSGADAPQFQRLAAALRESPRTVVRLYSLDREMQVVLLCLKRLAGLDVLYTDANEGDVADYWNTKATLHPTVEDARALDVASLAPGEMLAAEAALSPLSRKLGLRFPALPGYTITGPALEQELSTAARLLIDRYAIRSGCLKPSQGGAGARIVTGVPLGDEAGVRRLAAAARSDEEYVLEAHVDYLRTELGGASLMAPSGHVRNGRVADGLTVQLMRGTSWQGNVYVDQASCADVGLATEQYRSMLEVIHDLHAAFTRNGLTLATAGVDFALGRVGGAFGEQALVALQDPNLSSHGAEYLRLYLDHVRASGGPRYGATKVIRPSQQASLGRLRECRPTPNARRRSEVLSVVPGSWGMIAAAAETPLEAVGQLLEDERHLVQAGLCEPTPPEPRRSG